MEQPGLTAPPVALAANGHLPAIVDTLQPTPAGPRVVRREAWLKTDDHDALRATYPGFACRVWVNYPQRLWQEVTSGENERAKAALKEIVLEHNGWIDSDGTPFPPASDPAFWDAVPDELAATVLTLLNLETSKLPNSLLPQRRKR